MSAWVNLVRCIAWEPPGSTRARRQLGSCWCSIMNAGRSRSWSTRSNAPARATEGVAFPYPRRGAPGALRAVPGAFCHPRLDVSLGPASGSRPRSLEFYGGDLSDLRSGGRGARRARASYTAVAHRALAAAAATHPVTRATLAHQSPGTQASLSQVQTQEAQCPGAQAIWARGALRRFRGHRG